jgi:hypothetical protein
MMRDIGMAVVLSTLMVGGWGSATDGRVDRVSAALQPEHEVPAVSSPAQGTFVARIDDDAAAVDYELSYSGLQANVVQAHIHMAQPNVNGGIMVWLCGTPGTPGPAGTQTCPQSGTVIGTITAANVIAVTSQGIAPGEFDEFVAALRKGLAYANVHTQQSPGGEIRGQIRPGRGHK